MGGGVHVSDLPPNYQWSIMQATGTDNPDDAQAVINGGVDLRTGSPAVCAAGGVFAFSIGASASLTVVGAVLAFR